MSATIPCTPCCATPQTTNIPGSQGVAGNNGTNGQNAYTVTTADFSTPGAVGSSVTVAVGSTAWMVVGMKVIIGQGAGAAITHPGPATFQVTGIGSLTSVTLQFLGYTGDVGTSTTISAGAIVTAAGVQSAAFPTTSKGDLIVDDGANNPAAHPVRLADGLTAQGLFADPNNTLGGSLGVLWKGGTVTVGNNITPVGNTADTNEDNLQNVQVPGGYMAANGYSLEFEAVFTLTNPNPDHIQIYMYLGTAPGNGGTLLVTTGNITQASGAIRISGRITRTGASAELIQGLIATSTATVTFEGTAALNTSNAMYISATGKEITNATANVIVQQQLHVKLCAL